MLDLESHLCQPVVDTDLWGAYKEKKAVLRDLHLIGSWGTGKSPGLDVLTVEFFRAFWEALGDDYAGTDYEFFAGALLTCLGTILDYMILPDKSYTVLGQNIHDNVQL
eukprot:g27429.t1